MCQEHREKEERRRLREMGKCGQCGGIMEDTGCGDQA
jgi:hypothetical protein